jgi:hypothetical protein
VHCSRQSTSHIGTIDADGAALAAIQALNAKLVEQETEMTLLKRELGGLRRAVKILLARPSPQGRVAQTR